VFTFEFHQQRAEMAREEFAKNGIDHLVAVDHRNIELDGFPESLHGKADSVFLDLPGPWNVRLFLHSPVFKLLVLYVEASGRHLK